MSDPVLACDEILRRRLRRRRTHLGLTRPELAERAGVPINSLIKWENGTAMPSFRAVAQIAPALHVSLDWLAGLDDTPPSEEGCHEA